MPSPYCWGHSLILGATVALAVPSWAQTGPKQPAVQVFSAGNECIQTGVDYTEDAGLTLQEKIRRMDQSFTRALNKFDECQDEDEYESEPQVQQQQKEADEAEAKAEVMMESERELEMKSENKESENQSKSQAADQIQSEEGVISSASSGDISGDESEPQVQQQQKEADEAEAKAGVMMESERELETEDAGLTLEEKIRRMDQAFSRSLSKFRESKNQFQMEVSGAQGDVAAENLPAGPSSVASGDLAGDEEPMQQPDGPQDSVSAPSDGLSVLANGKLPDDILPSDNDSILEAQIRQAAINETDPELQKKLWNEYRKYKGLPPV